MIEIQNISPINKGDLLATCDVYIKPWHYTFIGVMIFQKGSNRWISMPSIKKEFNGEVKYQETGRWDSEAVRNKFKSQVMGAIDKFIQENPNMEVPDVITEKDDLPF